MGDDGDGVAHELDDVRVMAMPRPVPCRLLWVELRSCSKASKTLSANSGDMPMHVSLTASSYLPACSPDAVWTRRTDTLPRQG